MAATDISRHTLSVLVEDIDGIISRVAAMFTRRAFTMVSITSATTETPGVNRITIVVDTDEEKIEQITKQLNKLVPVLKVVRLAEDQMIARALLMVKVSADNSNRRLSTPRNFSAPELSTSHKNRWSLRPLVAMTSCVHCWTCWSLLASVSCLNVGRSH